MDNFLEQQPMPGNPRRGLSHQAVGTRQPILRHLPSRVDRQGATGGYQRGHQRRQGQGLQSTARNFSGDEIDSEFSIGREPQYTQVRERRTPRDHYGANKKGPPAHCLTGEKITELATLGDVGEIISLISQNEVGFMKAFKHRKFLQHKLTLKNLIKILFNLVQSDEAAQSASHVMSQILEPVSEYAMFLTSVGQLFQSIPTEQKRHIRRENIEAFSQFVCIGKFCIEKIPNNTLQSFQLPLLNSYATRAKMYVKHDEVPLLEAIESDLQELQQAFDAFETEKHRQQLKPMPTRRTRQMIDAERDPPEPFTDLSILPVASELSCEAKPFLRPNITEKCYNNWGHYVDIQFRLLREDFVRPLRKGIDDHLVGISGPGADVRVYTKVRILQPVSLSSGLGFDISFDCQSFRRLNWNYTKRLINGSLLCLSADKFVTIAFATVAERKVDLLQQGVVTVKFEGSISGFQLNPDSEYTMVESVAYFEAYRHILKRLQEVITSNEIETMPYKQYIVDCSFDEIPLPLYTRFMQRRARFDLHGVIKFKRRHANTAVDLTDISTWPSADITDLDHSQMEAMKAAMTQDISVIQGPPGTGKTYIGLKIVQGLLANRAIWDPHKQSPILVVCYTNHALDQFLEGIRQNPVNGESPNLTRIGGRCKSDLLADCTLYEKVNRAKEARSFPRDLHREFAASRTEMMSMKKEIENLMNEIQSTKQTLLSDEVISEYISRHHYEQLKSLHRGMKLVEAWLGLQFSLGQTSPQPDDQATLTEQLQESSDDDSENEVQMILDDRLVEKHEKVYRPRQQEIVIPFDMAELTQEIDPEGWRTVQMSKKKRQKLVQKQLSRGLEPLRAEDVEDIRFLQPQEKWRLYIYWRDKHVEHLLQNLQTISTDYEQACKDFQAKKQDRDDYAVNGSDVVGMTTTGAAKYNHIIKAIKPKIVVVEEAAEIFEPHIFTSISPSVQQLILIGDHKQLRPKPTCYELETKYNFNISLFERLANMGCPVQSLSIQHRMRPEIASLITPTIYETLYNDESVEKYTHIKGLGKNLFFVHHNFAEMSDNIDRKSHSNPHEARFLTALCDYLIKQGYDPSEITMLTLYSGQVMEIKKNLKQRKLTGVRTVVVDDFQGEENEIILLSLVRSNSDKQIGFVATNNRVCVALSRAKKGMFIIGNALMLADKSDTFWPEVLHQLQKTKSLGKALPLQCQIHLKDKPIQVERAEDFAKCPEGGCQRLCNTRLDCGHACKRMCHPTDREHKNYKCKEKTFKKLPGCGHYEMVVCSTNLTHVNCTKRCDKILACGHQCAEKCSQSCTTKCKHPVNKKLSCGHTVQADCSIKPEDIVCTLPCNSLLECGHECGGTCGECNRGRLHVQCKAKCGRTLICEHICKFPCTPECPPCTEPCTNYCVHSHCPKMCFEPCQPCQERCRWRCKHKICTRPCGEPCDRDPCNEPCTKRLKCGHQCIGMCGEPCPKLCRICNKDEVTEIFFGDEDEEDAQFVLLPDCGHIFEYKGLDQWMNTKQDQSQQISYKQCPKCKTPVKKCLRYSNAIKQYLKDVEEIKRKQMSALRADNLKGELVEVKQSLDNITLGLIGEDLAHLERIIDIDSQPGRKQLLMFPHVIRAKLTLLSQIAAVTKLQSRVSNELEQLAQTPDVGDVSSRIRRVKRGLNRVQEFIRQDYLFQQQMSDAETEMRRLTLMVKISEFQQKMLSQRVKLTSTDDNIIKAHSHKLLYSGWINEKVSKEKENDILRQLETLIKKYGLDGLTEMKREEIVKAIGLSKGHWFKCPNGHYYCIGECGGAMETAKCPECNAQIGGSHHQLLASNQLAPEMDGARYAAWSEMANLENFDQQDLARL